MALRGGEEYDSDDSNTSIDSDEEIEVEDYWIGVVVRECAVAAVRTAIADTVPPITVDRGTEYMVIRWLKHDADVQLDGAARKFIIQEGLSPVVLTDRLPSVIPVKLGVLKGAAKKAVISKEKNTKIMAVLEPGGPGLGGRFE